MDELSVTCAHMQAVDVIGFVRYPPCYLSMDIRYLGTYVLK